MPSEVDVVNLALSNIRVGSINSLNESSLPAQVAKLKYPFMRDRMLKEAVWQFNRQIRPLSLLTTELFNWAYTYQYPIDCLKIHRILPNWEGVSSVGSDTVSRHRDPDLLSLRNVSIPYSVYNVDGNKVIGSNDSELHIDFVARITDPNLFSDDFILALSHLLAAEMAIPLVGVETGRQLRSDSLTMYQEYLSAAIADDMNDGYHTPQESEFVTIRR